ncbi:unnamed protein product [Spirodela intermedia]|uniref:Uncharacterized protein n=1 Tax=Spirodela intermedia TaxID=51605 RepID=A0A7I8K9Q4_SPIIN|nr:unnamed protein product [Spirodela intermedia]
MNLSARGGAKLEASSLPTSPSPSVLLHRRPLFVASRSAASSPPRAIRHAGELPPPVLLRRLRFLSNRPPRVPRCLRRSEFRTGMEAARESSPESTTSGGDGFIYVSGVEITDAEGSRTDPDPGRGISGGGARGENAILPDEAPGVGFDEEFEDSEVGLEDFMEEPKRVLPEELAKGVVVLECESSAEGGSCDVYLVGTAHVSQESCREVKAIIRCLKPQVVFLELCASRVAILTPQNLKVPTMNEMIDMWKKRDSNIFGILYSFFLAKVASKLEVFPGAEFRVAFEEARNFGAKVILGDRPVQITLRRTWGRMSLWHKAKFLSYMIFQSIFLPSSEDLNKLLKDLDDGDMLTLLIQEMSKAFPTLIETLLIERDMYMSSKLLKVASEHSSVVAVVGRGHLAGIKKHWKQPLQINHLLEVPKRNPHTTTVKILASLGFAATGAAIISGIYLASRR